MGSGCFSVKCDGECYKKRDASVCWRLACRSGAERQITSVGSEPASGQVGRWEWEQLTTLHLRMYRVMCADCGAFHWMGWELGWFPVSVMITWTGRLPPERRRRQTEGEAVTHKIIIMRCCAQMLKDKGAFSVYSISNIIVSLWLWTSDHWIYCVNFKNATGRISECAAVLLWTEHRQGEEKVSRPCEIPAQISTAGGEKTQTRLSLLFNPSQTSTCFLAIQFSKDAFTGHCF